MADDWSAFPAASRAAPAKASPWDAFPAVAPAGVIDKAAQKRQPMALRDEGTGVEDQTPAPAVDDPQNEGMWPMAGRPAAPVQEGQTATQALLNALAKGAVTGVGEQLRGAGTAVQMAGSKNADQALSAMRRIDQGDDVPEQEDVLGYGQMSPEQRAETKRQFDEYASRPAPTGLSTQPNARPENWMQTAGRNVAEFGEQQFPVAKEQEGLATRVMGGLGGLMPLVLGGAAGSIAAGPVGGAAMVTLPIWAQSYDSTFKEAIDKGASPQDADSAALNNAATQAAVMSAPIGRLFHAIPEGLREGFLRTMINLGKHGVEFGSLNSVGAFASNYVAKNTYDPERPLMQGVGDAALEGTIMGMVVPAAGAFLRRPGPRQPGEIPEIRVPQGFGEPPALPAGEPAPEPPPAPPGAAAPPSGPPRPPRSAEDIEDRLGVGPEQAQKLHDADVERYKAEVAAWKQTLEEVLPGMKPPAEVPPTTPEPLEDTVAQVRAILDPSSNKDTAFFAAGTTLPPLPTDGSIDVVKRPEGVLVTQDPDKAEAFQKAYKITDAMMAKLLDYQEPKGAAVASSAPLVVQATDPAGNVVSEALSSPANVPAATEAAKEQAPEGGDVRVVTPQQAQQRRQDLNGVPVTIDGQQFRVVHEPPAHPNGAPTYRAFDDVGNVVAVGSNPAEMADNVRAHLEAKKRVAAQAAEPPRTQAEPPPNPVEPAKAPEPAAPAQALEALDAAANEADDRYQAAYNAWFDKWQAIERPSPTAFRGLSAAEAMQKSDELNALVPLEKAARDAAQAYRDARTATDAKTAEPPKAEAPAPQPEAEKPAEKPPIVAEAKPAAPSAALPIVEHITAKGKTLRGVIRTDLTKDQAHAIDKFTFKKGNGWFIREAAQQAAEAAKPAEATAPVAEAKPAEAPKAPEWREVGKNAAGETLYEDARGVRSVLRDGMRHTEPVQMRPTRDGMRPEPPTETSRGAGYKIAPKVEQPKPEEPKAEKPEAEPPPQEKPGYGAGNKTFTADAAERARQRLREKMGRLNAGFDPEMMLDGRTLAGFHIEAGARKFADYAKAMIGDLGNGIQPFLKHLYNSVKDYPGFDNRGMSEAHEVDAAFREMAEKPPQETEHGVQRPVSTRPPGSGPEDVHGVAPSGEAGGAPSTEGAAGSGNAAPTPGGGRQGTGRQADHGGGEGSRGNRPGDADRVPATGGPAEPGASARPAEERDANVRGQNFVLAPGAVEEGRGPGAKARDNLAAIELAKRLTDSGTAASIAEQAILAKYVGWGGLAGAFPDPTSGQFGKGLEHIGRQLRDSLTSTEYETAARSTQYAHYTAENVIRSMWDAVHAMGFKGGNVFEPGMGVGHFLGMMPQELAAESRYQGVEMDHLTAMIAKLLYPQSGVRQRDFTRLPIPEKSFDLAIGNPPFSDTVIKADPKYAARGFMLHDYFFAKSIDSVRPGGLMAFVTSAGTMNKLDTDARHYLAQRAEFLGGVRLPSTAFKKNAGTEVTTDILFFKRRPGDGLVPLEEAGPVDWADTVIRTLPNAEGVPTQGNVSKYFSDHPEQVLGEEGFFDKLYKGRYGVHERPGSDLTTDLREALGRLPKDVMDPPVSPEERAKLDFDSGQKKDGSFYLGKDGTLMRYYGGAGRPVEARGGGVKGGMTAADREHVTHLIPIRDALRDVFRHDLAENTADAAKARKALNKHYDAFVAKFGPINKAEFTYRRPTIVQQETARQEARETARERGEPFNPGTFDETDMVAQKKKSAEIARARQDMRDLYATAGRAFDEGDFNPADMADVVIEKRPNIAAFMGDPESYRLRSIESYDDVTGAHSKKPIFERSIISRHVEPEIKSANDGVLWSMNAFGRFDLPKIAEKMGRSPQSIVDELGDAVFRVPGQGETYQTKDEYLSGDVVSKLQIAQTLAASEPDIRRNLPALEAATPVPLPPSQIGMRLGMPWIPPSQFVDFADHLGLGRPHIERASALGQWFVSGGNTGRYQTASAPGSTTEGITKWSTNRLDPYELMAHALNRVPPKIYSSDGGRPPKNYFDATATQAAQDKIDALQQEFADWLRDDEARSDALAKLYNDALNREVVRVYDGSYLTTPGVAASWSWCPHQTKVVARIVQAGNTYMAHAVGAGKTSAMIGAGMEMRRLGLVSKPMYVVPNHMLGQFTKEFYEQYPTARIAVADESNFHTDTRKQFVANVAQDDLDAVIITHSAFGKVPISEAFQADLIQEQVDMLRDAISGLDPKSDRITVKKLENQIEKMEQKLSKRGSGEKDETLSFEEMGVDFLFVDEAHNFRKLDFATKQSNLKGISPEGSDMAWDLYTKIRYLDGNRPGRSVVLASGTPVTNTMGELYTISRYLQPQALRDRSLSHFDSWAQSFGDVKSDWEQNAAGGYAPVTRFAKFVNMPELYKMVAGVMDIVTSAELSKYVTRPALEGGARKFHLAPRSAVLDAYQQELAARMDAIKQRKGPPQKGDDILLSVINDGRHAAIDPRFVSQGVQSNEPSKLNMMLDNVFNIWKGSKNTQFYDPASDYTKKSMKGPATQMIFANLGVNQRGPANFSTYAWIKEYLRRKGVPEGEVAFIGDYTTHVARQRLFNDMNEGKVRILVGSTQKMGTGVNAQRRLLAIHNLDPLWYPADDEQRVGRGLRQGNHNPFLQVHDYSTKGTYDSSMWSMMGRKGRFIEQFFRGDPSLREMEDLGEASMYEQAAGIATMDERVLVMTQMKQDLDRLYRQRDANESRQYSIRNQIGFKESSAKSNDEQAARIDGWLEKLKPTRGDKFEMKVGAETFKKRKDADAALEAAINAAHDNAIETTNDRPYTLGEIGGFPLTVKHVFRETGKNATVFWYRRFNLQMGGGHTIDLGSDAGSVRAVAENKLADLPEQPGWLRKSAADQRREADGMRTQIGQKFGGDAEIAELRRSIANLEAEMSGQKPAGPVVAPPPEPMPTYGLARTTTLENGEFAEQADQRPPSVRQAPMFGRRSPSRVPQTETPAFGRKLPFYSAVERAVGMLKQEKGTGEQMLSAINKTPGVKAEELKWLGLPDWLRGQKTVTKAQIADYVRANALDVQEVMKGATGMDYHVDPEEAQHEPAGELAPEEQAEFAQATKFSGYQLPGGTGYREMLITLPRRNPLALHSGLEIRQTPSGAWNLWDSTGSPGWTWRDDLPTREAAETRAFADEMLTKPSGADYRSPHWEEPNVLAHVRFSERVAPDGKKVLLIEENQSDWHQAGRKRGYRGDADAAAAAARAKVKEIEVEQDQMIQAVARQHDLSRYEGGFLESKAYDLMPKADQERYVALSDKRTEALSHVFDADNKGNRVPDAPFATTWPSLVMKRMIQYAVDNGFDRVAWVPGDVQADRYDLSKHISRLELHHSQYEPDWLQAYDLSGRRVIDERVTPEQLPDMIGKEAAEKLLAAPREPGKRNVPGEMQRLSGLQLKIGGAGMRGFYDTILPSETNKLVGKFGAKVGKSEIGSVGETPEYVGPTPTAEQWNALRKIAASTNNSRISPITGREVMFPLGRVSNESAVRDVDKRMAAGATFAEAMSHQGHEFAEIVGGELRATETRVSVHSFDVTDSLRKAVTSEGLPLFERHEAAMSRADAYPHPDVVQAIVDNAARITGNKVRIEAYDADHHFFTVRHPDGSTQQVYGYQLGRLIRIAVEASPAEMARNLNHEVLHALKAMGVFTDIEWRTLVATAKREGWLERYDILNRYADKTPNEQMEEAICDHFAQIGAGAEALKPGSFLARMWDKIRQFFARLRNAIAGRGFQSVQDIFGKVHAGEVGEREPGSGMMQKGPTTVRESQEALHDWFNEGAAAGRREPPVAVFDTPTLRAAVSNTPGASIDAAGLHLPAIRHSKPQYVGEASHRGAVFYSGNEAMANVFRGSFGDAGGQHQIMRTLNFRNPLVVTAPDGGAMRSGLRALLGKDAFKKLFDEVREEARAFTNGERTVEEFGDFMAKHGVVLADPRAFADAYDISGQPHEMLIPMLERILVEKAKAAGYDGIVAIARRRPAEGAHPEEPAGVYEIADLRSAVPAQEPAYGRRREPGTFDLSYSPEKRGSEETTIGAATVEYHAKRDGKTVMVDRITTSDDMRGQGEARRAMEQMVVEADAAGKRLELISEPQEPGISQRRLDAFYRSLGFSRQRGGNSVFVREPGAKTKDAEVAFGRRRQGNSPQDEVTEARRQFLAKAEPSPTREWIADKAKKMTAPLRGPIKAALESKPMQDLITGETTKRALDAGNAFAREVAMFVDPMQTGSNRAQAAAKDFANALRQIDWHLKKLDDDIVAKFRAPERALMGSALDEQSVFDQGVRDQTDEMAAKMKAEADQMAADGADRSTINAFKRAEKAKIAEFKAEQEKAYAAEGKGLARLNPEQRAMVDMVSSLADRQWDLLIRVGIVDGRRLPHYMPRYFIMVNRETGAITRPPIGEGHAPQMNPVGGNLRTAGPPRRKHRETEETVTAGKAKLGEGAELVTDIRAMMVALQKSARSIAGKQLVDAIRDIGQKAAVETIADEPKPGFKELPHPALTRLEPAYVRDSYGDVVLSNEDGKPLLRLDEDGRPIMTRRPIYVADEFEGPLRSVLNSPPSMFYSALMQAKSLGVSLIMASPMTHNMVIWGKAFPLMRGKMITLQAYSIGHMARTGMTYAESIKEWRKPGSGRVDNPGATAFMRKMIRGGMVPIGQRWLQDITGIAEDVGGPVGKTPIAKGAGWVAGKVAGPGAAEKTKAAVDAAGDFWHGTLLWERIADLQAGIAQMFYERALQDGLSESEAVGVAAHISNRFAGVLPNEATSQMLRRILNIVFFSRSFTFGNASIMRDAKQGLPSDLAAQIERDSGPQAAKAAKAYARGISWHTLAAEMALFYGMGAVLQLGIQAISRYLNDDEGDAVDKMGRIGTEIAKGFVHRFEGMLERRNEHPLNWLDPRNVLTIPMELMPLWSNEPGKQDRIFFGVDARGRAIYFRNPVGKVGEEFKNWLTQPVTQASNKLSNIVKPISEILMNKDSMGRQIFDPEGYQTLIGSVEVLGRSIAHYISAQLPTAMLEGGYDLVTGAPEPGISLGKSAVPALTGLTVSRGNPAGPEAGIKQQVAERAKQEFFKEYPKVREAVARDDLDEAVRILVEKLGERPAEARNHIRNLISPERRNKPGGYLDRQFQEHATPEDRRRLENVPH